MYKKSLINIIKAIPSSVLLLLWSIMIVVDNNKKVCHLRLLSYYIFLRLLSLNSQQNPSLETLAIRRN